MESEVKMVYDPSLPAYAKGTFNSFLPLKFFSAEIYRDYFLSGKLYMRQHSAFVNEELGEGRSDCTEGADFAVTPFYANTFPDVKLCVADDGEVYVEATEYTEKPANYREKQLFISRPMQSQRRNIFSMYTLWCNKEKELTAKIDVENMKNFGEFGVLVLDTNAFFNRIAMAANADMSISRMSCGFVHYIEGRNVMRLTPFTKPANGFSYQNEFRFCAETDNEDLLELDTHKSFRDIAIPIQLQEFADTVIFKNGKLYFKADTSAGR